MRPEVVVLPANGSIAGAAALLGTTARVQAQRLYPIVDGEGALVGVTTRGAVEAIAADPVAATRRLADIAEPPVVAHADEPLRAAVHRMAETGYTRLPVVDGASPPRLRGLVTLKEALTARARHLEEEGRREVVLPLAALVPFRGRRLRSLPKPAASDEEPGSRRGAAT